MKVFVEEQRFKRWILISVMVILIVAVIIPLVIDNEEIPELYSDGFWGLTITFVIVIAVFIFILSIRLQTKINEQGVYYQFFPNQLSEKFISWYDIDKCYIRKSKFGNFGTGGYGYRRCFFGKSKGVVMNLGGKYGIQLELKNGKNILIGTQKESDAKKVLETYKNKFTPNERQ